MFPRLTDVVKNLIIINALCFLAAMVAHQAGFNLQGFLALYYPASDYFQPFQLVSSMFMHGDLGHLFFNMLMLAFLGPAVEMLWGPKRFLIYYLVCGFGATALHLIVKYIEIEYFGVGSINNSVLGASGAISGVILAYGVKFPYRELRLIIPPITIKGWQLAAGLLCMDFFFAITNLQPGVAHFAHLGGALIGFILIQFWLRFGTRF